MRGVLVLFALLVVGLPSSQPAVTSPDNTATATLGATSTALGRIGDRIRYPDGWKLTVQRLDEQPPPSPGSFNTMSPGFRLVVVTVRFDNGATATIAPSSSDFKLQDSNGVRRGSFSLGLRSERADQLKSDDLASSGFVIGTIVFEAPRGDQRLTLVYEPRRRGAISVQLY